MVWFECEGPGHIWHTISAWEETGGKVWLIADLDDHCICHIGSLS